MRCSGPSSLYFVWHSLHARVEANWFAPVYPAFAIAAAVAAHLVRWDARWQRVADFCLRWASPVGILMFALLIVQADTGVLTGYRRDATVRSVGVGWRELAAEIEAVRERVGARLRPGAGLRHHELAGLLSAQRHLRAAADAAHPLGQHARARSAQLAGKLLYVDEVRHEDSRYLDQTFSRIERVAELPRKRGPLTIETYGLDLVEGAERRCARPFAAAGIGVGRHIMASCPSIRRHNRAFLGQRNESRFSRNY